MNEELFFGMRETDVVNVHEMKFRNFHFKNHNGFVGIDFKKDDELYHLLLHVHCDETYSVSVSRHTPDAGRFLDVATLSFAISFDRLFSLTVAAIVETDSIIEFLKLFEQKTGHALREF